VVCRNPAVAAERARFRLDVWATIGPRRRGRTLRIAHHADVAQLVERRLPKPKVASSSLVVRLQNLARPLRISPQTTGFWQWFDSRRTCEDRRGCACAAELEVASWSHRPEWWINRGQSLTRSGWPPQADEAGRSEGRARTVGRSPPIIEAVRVGGCDVRGDGHVPEGRGRG
jgi:hypothetical protein